MGRADRPTARLTEALAQEKAAGLDRIDFYADFGQRVDQLRIDLMKMLRELAAEGRTIAAYGAAAKGATLLNVVDITCDRVPYVVDRNTYKQGRYMPGTNQLICDPSVLETEPPDVLLLLAWNFAPEIIAQQQGYARSGGRFLVPVPTPELI